MLIRCYRVRGHVIAQLDPLGRQRPMPPELDPAFYKFAEDDPLLTHLRNTFSWTPRSRPACATDTPRSLTSLTASTLNSRLNFRLCMTYLRFDKTPNLGVHQTGSSSVKVLQRSGESRKARAFPYSLPLS